MLINCVTRPLGELYKWNNGEVISPHLSRRGFVRSAIAAVAGVYGGSTVLSSCGDAEDASSLESGTLVIPDITVVPEGEMLPFITPQSQFYRIDTAIGNTPQIDAATWSMRITGMVDRDVILTLEDINAMPQTSHVITLGCVSNEVGGDLIGTAQWGGVLLSEVLKLSGVKSGAEQLVSTSVDGWTCGTPLDAVMDGRPAMLVTSMNGEALSQEHGYPVRMIVPGLFGYVSATKWLSEISLSTWDAFDAYWIERGWSKTGPFLASSRIDVPRNGASVAAGKTIVGGFAWAPRSGVKAVQLQIDDDEWLEAELLDGSTGDTWTQWKYEWNANPGDHRLTVRCVSGNGEVQTDEVTRVDPDGARGHHQIDVSCA